LGRLIGALKLMGEGVCTCSSHVSTLARRLSLPATRDRGIGQTTGDKYQATGVTQDQFNAKVGVEETFINDFRIIGQGNGNNFLIHETFHITINANEIPTASVDNFSVDCR
jgi:hypothetical protein